jgi:hypothetical protein
MSLNQHLVKDLGGMENGLLATMAHNDTKFMAEETDLAFEEVEMRATKIGLVLEGILQEAHGTSRWGLNE